MDVDFLLAASAAVLFVTVVGVKGKYLVVGEADSGASSEYLLASGGKSITGGEYDGIWIWRCEYNGELVCGGLGGKYPGGEYLGSSGACLEMLGGEYLGASRAWGRFGTYIGSRA